MARLGERAGEALSPLAQALEEIPTDVVLATHVASGALLGQHRRMLDVADRAAFLRWLDNSQDDLLDSINQRPRSIKMWVADYARALKSATAEMGMDRGHAGIFGDHDEEMGLHDPEAEDEEESW